MPFCSGKCYYCDFYSVSMDTETVNFYTNKVINEIDNFALKFPDSLIRTIYIGGGTPSILPIESLDRIISKVHSSFKSQIDEFTIEINPAETQYINQYKGLGINRVSVGIQSLDDKVLSIAGRRHNPKQALDCLNSLNSIFSNISCDLIIGLPYETKDNFLNSLYVLSNFVNHFSLYILKIANSTPFFSLYNSNPSVFPLEDSIVDTYNQAKYELEKLSFFRYEVSNFSKKGYKSLHNLSYWNRTDYFGVGPSAASLIDNERIIVPPDNYFVEDNITRNLEEALSVDNQMMETIILSLRLEEGINIANFEECYKVKIFDVFRDAINKNRNYLEITDAYIKIKDEFLLLQNQIMIDFLQ